MSEHVKSLEQGEMCIADEFAVDLGDARRTRRVQRVVEALSAAPDAAFPEVFDNDEELEAFYRIVRNRSLRFDGLLEGHIEQTALRSEKVGEVLVLHDTTEFRFPLRRDIARPGLCKFGAKRQGFLGQASLVVSSDGLRCPLGMVGFRPFVHKRGVIVDDREPSFWHDVDGVLESEYDRWMAAVEASQKRLKAVDSVVHVMDREADSFETVGTMSHHSWRYVVRLGQERIVVESRGKSCQESDTVEEEEDPTREVISQVLSRQPVICRRTVTLAPRYDNNRPLSARKKHPSRRKRQAKLSLRACTVTVPQPRSPKKDLSHLPEEVTVNVVEAFEENPPEGEPAVRWLLATSEPIEQVEDILCVLDIYRARWMVEEYFKALKTGCGYSKRQLNSARTLVAALALCIPIAWKLLAMRHLDRHAKDAPAECVVNDTQLLLLRKRYPKLEWSSPATVGQATRAIAKLGGHIKANGPPGWMVLGRGYSTLLDMEAGVRMLLGNNR